jgi:hypothetical protein
MAPQMAPLREHHYRRKGLPFLAAVVAVVIF